MHLNYQMDTVLEASMNSYMPIGVYEVMQCLDISKSAAYLLIQDCEIWLKENKIEFISSDLRRELNLADQASRDKLRESLSGMKPADYDFSVKERRIYIILMLLRRKNVRTNEIIERFHVSRNTCILDFAGVNKLLQPFNAGFSSGNFGYTLRGNEYDVYRLCLWAVSEILYELYPNNYEMAISLFDFPKEMVENIYRTLLGTMNQFKILCNREAGYIFSMTFTLVKIRISLKGLFPIENIPHYEEMNRYSYRIRRMLIHLGIVEEVLRDFCPGSGKGFLEDSQKVEAAECLSRMLIYVCAETGNDLIAIHVNEEDLKRYAVQIIQQYECYAGIVFEDREELKNTVALSMKCVLLRKKYGFFIFNPLIKEIRKHYSHIIHITNKALEGIHYIEKPVSEVESIRFSVNFLGWMYKSKRVTFQTPHILVMCAGNAGTGILMQGQIEKLVPEAKIRTVSLLQEYSKFTEHIDFIVSTIPVEIKDIPVVVVNVFLTEYDKYRIRKIIENKSVRDLDLKRFIQDFIIMAKDFITSEEVPLLRHRVEEYFKINKAKIIYETEGKPMLKDLISERRIQIVDFAEDWRAAIRLAAKPLEEDQSIEPSYTEAMIHTVETLGPYIVLAPGIALPHARPEAGVCVMSMALMKVKEKVYFSEDKYANLFFVLASIDGSSHLDALRELSMIFSDEAALDKFMKAETTNELYRLIQ